MEEARYRIGRSNEASRGVSFPVEDGAGWLQQVESSASAPVISA